MLLTTKVTKDAEEQSERQATGTQDSGQTDAGHNHTAKIGVNAATLLILLMDKGKVVAAFVAGAIFVA